MSIFSKYSKKVSLKPRKISRCFWAEVSCTGLLLKTSWGWAVTFILRLNMTSCASLLITSNKIKTYFWKVSSELMLCKPLLIWIAVLFGSVTLENNEALSVNNFGFEVRHLPWTSTQKERSPFKTTCCFLSLSKSFMRRICQIFHFALT